MPRKHETILLLESKAHAIRGPLSSSEYAGAKLLVCFGAGARGPGSLGWAPVVATASFPLINLPNFILASLS